MPPITGYGTIRDLLGHPVSGVGIEIVAGYQMLDDWLWEPEWRGPVADPVVVRTVGWHPAGDDGSFEFSISRNDPQLGARVRSASATTGRRIWSNAPTTTKTNIPFRFVELRKTGDQAAPLPTRFDALDIYLDPSREMLWRFWWYRRGRMAYALEHADGYGYQGDHRDPDSWGDYIEWSAAPDTRWQRSHWGFPKIDDDRGINIPWGYREAVVPFVVAEGNVFQTLVQTGGDYDRLFRAVLEPAYGHLLNKHNEGHDSPLGYVQRFAGHSQALEGEMCSWFMGKRLTERRFAPSETNVQRNEDAGELAARFVDKRVWMVGTWCRETGPDRTAIGGSYHAPWNELHPVYWIVPFSGGWRRLFASEMVYLEQTDDPAALIASVHGDSPSMLLRVLKTTVEAILQSRAQRSWPVACDFYAQTVVRLNGYGANMEQPGLPSGANSLDYSTHINWAAERPLDDLKRELARRIDVNHGLLEKLGSGILVFPCMAFVFQSTRLTEFCRSLGFEPPVLDSVIRTHPILQVALGRHAISRAEAFFGGDPPEDVRFGYSLTLEWSDLEEAYRSVFRRLASEGAIPADTIASFYATSRRHLVSYGAFNSAREPLSPDADHRFAVLRAKSSPDALSARLNGLLRVLWRDSFPHVRSDS